MIFIAVVDADEERRIDGAVTIQVTNNQCAADSGSQPPRESKAVNVGQPVPAQLQEECRSGLCASNNNSSSSRTRRAEDCGCDVV
jgi:hypothetical protein